MAERSSRRRQKTREIPLEQVRDTREGLTLMRASETVTIDPSKLFVLVPGEKGFGWILRVYEDE